MKKLSMIAAAFAVMFAMASCSSPADKAVEFSEEMKAAAAAGDYEKLAEIEKAAVEWQKSLSPEEQKEAKAAVNEWLKQQSADVLQGLGL